MNTPYEMFNEITFESYVKAAIDKSILKERLKKRERDKWEKPYSSLTGAMLDALSYVDAGIDRAEKYCRVFHVQGTDSPVYDERLGQAISILMPKDREIILSYFFLQDETEEIAHRMNIDPTTVRRRYKKTVQKIRDYLEDTI